MLCVKIAWKRMQTKEKQKAIREKRALEIEHNLREQGKRTRKTNETKEKIPKLRHTQEE